MLQRRWPYFVLTAFNLFAIAYLSHLNRYFFLQDDNWAQFGPMIMSGAENFFRHFTLPYWSPWTSLGVPALEVGTYALLYPVTYLAYAIARWGLGDAQLTLEVFCYTHLVAGTYMAYAYFNSLFRDRRTAVFAALAFCYSGFFLVAGRSWYYMTPVAFYLPALFYFQLKIPGREIKAKQEWLLALVIALFFLSGNAQMWVYAILFWFLATFFYGLVALKISLRNLIAFFLGLAGKTVLIMGPQLLLQGQFIRDVERYALGGGLEWGLANFFVPAFVYNSPFPPDCLSQGDSGALYFGGALFLIVSIAGLAQLLFLRDKVFSREEFSAREKFFVPLYGFFLVLAIMWGYSGGQHSFWMFMSRFPPFRFFSMPIKFIPFVHFFATLFAAFRFGKYFRRDFWAKNWIFACLLILLAAHVTRSNSAFYFYRSDGYPLENSALKELPSDVRIMNGFATRLQSPEYPLLLPHNLGVLARKLTVFGYDPFVSDNRNSALFFGDVFKGAATELGKYYGVGYTLLEKEGRITGAPVTGSDPLAFCEQSGRPLRVEWDWNALTLPGAGKCDIAGESIVLGWTYWKYFRVDQAGYDVDRDPYLRLRLTPRSKASLLPAKVIYSPPLFQYLLLCFVVFLLTQILRRSLWVST